MENTESKSCIACGASYVDGICGVARCPQCGLLFSGQTAGFGNSIQGMNAIAQRNYAIVADALKKALSLRGARILDVGSAEGGFTELMLREGADCVGLEPDRDAAREALEKKLPVELVGFEGFVGEKDFYDAIVFNDVFEHMQSPTLSLEKSCDLLKDGGLILINLPVSTGFIFRMVGIAARLGVDTLYRRIWAQGLASPHIYFYSERNLTALAGKFGFRLIGKGRLVALATEGMYQRVRSTYGPFPAIVISGIASLFVFVSNLFSADVVYLMFKRNE
ncbi:class I SAM-dependent methyltransferase [Uliginosibacterium sp. TH139]|uniref:class I SAM-dependent methyltransferase n=1 Tax=Uliginosibacterium sp. TH139 TaxID=2067453 RepID=UPI000C7C8C83|nr:class I SAM-dependent methyltransferase [Uliginosibacterium sp. TH139]PLK49125.1 hypothetical protein C0V76_07950 [Uliginosibacterium sp. TH139]